MNEQRDLGRRVSDWLEEEARGELPDWVLEETFEQTRTEPQEFTFRARLRSLRPAARGEDEPSARRGFTMFTALRAAVIALLIGVVGFGAALIVIDTEPTPAPTASESAPGIEPTPLLDLTFDGGIIPEEFAGVLFSRKTYPADQEIVYTPAFLPPNTFIRYVESGELGIRPNDDTQVIRAGGTQGEAEVVAAGEETVIGAGDIFIQRDVPWQEYGEHALGEMWTPGEDAVIFSLAIREPERCCAMGHTGMVSRWYHTLTSGVQELGDEPMRFRVQTWEIPVGDSLDYTTQTTPNLWAVDSGEVLALTKEDASSGEPTTSRPIQANSPIWLMSLDPGAEVVVDNVGEAPAILYQLTIEPAAMSADDGTSSRTIAVSEGPRMARTRAGHEATNLADGRLLISGGGWADVEIFDPHTNSFELAGEMARIRPVSASLLADGRVLVAGGDPPIAEVYDPQAMTFEEVGPMAVARQSHAAAALLSGEVLILGGETDSAERYDPDSGTFTDVGPMSTARSEPAALVLDDGRVLISGGGRPFAELYDPATGEFAPVESPTSGRLHHTMTLLPDGRVAIIGDRQVAEILDLASLLSESTGPMAVPRWHHAAALLPDGRVLAIGGMTMKDHEPTSSIEVLDLATGEFTEVGSLSVARWGATATALADGRVLVTGGSTSQANLNTTEIIAPIGS